MATYKDYVLEANPVALWPMESTGSSETDLTMGRRDSIISVSDKTSNPVVPGTDRCYNIGQSDTIYYPSLNIFSPGNHGTSFSVEFIIKPIDSVNTITIFGANSASGAVADNGIYLKNNKLSFIVSSGGDRYESYTYFDMPGETYHVVASYQPNSLTLYINGIKVHSISIDNSVDWTFTPHASNFYLTSGAAQSTWLLSMLAVYKGLFPIERMPVHYRAATLRTTPLDIAYPKSGNLFMINDSDRVKSFIFSEPMQSGWLNGKIDNLYITNNKLSLRKISAPIMTSGSPTFAGNKLSLSSSQALQIDNAGDFLTSFGAVGLYADFTTARHAILSSGEYHMLSIFNSEKTYVINVLEKSDKKIYIRYTNGAVVTEALLYSPSLVANSTNYLYLEYTSDGIKAYWNSASNTATINFDQSAGVTAPVFDTNSTVIVGASESLSGYWGAGVSYINLWYSLRDTAYFSYFKDEVYEYTLKLSSSLNVSQSGSATYILDTATDDPTETINQSRIWWAPFSTNTLVKTGSSSIGLNTQTYNHGYNEGYAGPSIGPDSSLVSETNMAQSVSATAGSVIPSRIYLKLILKTDDSFNDVTTLTKAGLDIFRDSEVVSERNFDRLAFGTSPLINFSTENIGLQSVYHGASIKSQQSACQILSDYSTDPITDNSSIPSGGSIAPPTIMSNGRTLEFFMTPEETSSGLVFKFSGAAQVHSLSYNYTTRVFTVQGFNSLYIDGALVTLSSGTSAARDTNFNKKTHLIHLVKNDVINQGDATLFTAASGSITTAIDSSKFYSGSKSLRVDVGGTLGWISVYNSIFGLDTAQNAQNTLSFFIYPPTGVTSVRTNFRANALGDSIVTHSGLVSGKWNLIKRTFTNPAILNQIDIRIGTSAISQIVWLDDVAVVPGSEPFLLFESTSTNSSWFGLDISSPGTAQAKFRLQNVSVYPKTFSLEDCLSHYKDFFGHNPVKLNLVGDNTFPTNLGNRLLDEYALDYLDQHGVPISGGPHTATTSTYVYQKKEKPYNTDYISEYSYETVYQDESYIGLYSPSYGQGGTDEAYVDVYATNYSDISPIGSYVLTDPNIIYNRNATSNGEVLFSSNPLLVSDTWQIVSSV